MQFWRYQVKAASGHGYGTWFETGASVRGRQQINLMLPLSDYSYLGNYFPIPPSSKAIIFERLPRISADQFSVITLTEQIARAVLRRVV